jgi:HK97 gp10 family phage protein
VSRRAPITAELDARSLRQLGEAMELAGDAAAAGVAAGVSLTAEATAFVEQLNVPVDTGALRDGIEIRYSASGQNAQVGIWRPDLYYALFVEWGTTIRPAVPFATPAAEKARATFPRNVITEVRRKVG